MKILGTATELAAANTKFTTSTNVYVFNTDTSAGVVTLRNEADDGSIGTIYVGAGAGMEVSLELGQGLRGANTLYGTQIASTGY